MKTLRLSVATLVFLGSCLGSYAQEIKKVSVPKDVYTESKSYQRVNQERVNEAFRKLNEVDVFDFTDAQLKSVNPELQQSVDLVLRKSTFVEYSNQAAIQSLFALRPEALSVQLPFKSEVLTIDLVLVNLFTDEFKLETSTPGLEKGVTFGLYYQGTIRGEDAVVGVSFFKDEFNVWINRNAGSNTTIEAGLMSDQKETGLHIVYADEDVKDMPTFACHAEELPQYQEAVERLASQKEVLEGNEKATYKCVTYFWETQYNLYTSKGSTQAVTNYMTSVFNNFKLLYENEQIGSKLNQLYVWTTQDAYNNNLNTFSANRSNFGANLATLFSTTGGGGVAWLDQICGSNEYYKHGFCGSVGATFGNVPTYSWTINVSAHEVGHNLGSPHTHACTWSGGPIDGCGAQAGYSEGCTGPIPSGGGTIMSYCHLTSTGINFNNGFGPQPGNLIRSRINSCITLTCESGSGGGGTDPCLTAFEPNETQATAATIAVGATNSAAISASGDIDYFKVTTAATTNNVFTLTGPSGVDFDMVIYNSAGTQLGAGTGSTASETVTLNNQAAGTYYIRVFGYNNTSSTTCYTIKATATTVQNCSTAYEPNNSTSAAATIPLATTISAAISTSTDQDFYKVTTTSSGTHKFALAGPGGVDYDLYVYNSAGTQIGAGTGSTATENVSITNLAVGTYTVRVIGYNGANSATCYTLNVAKTTASFSGEDLAPEVSYTVFPNPTKDKLSVTSSNPDDVMDLEVRDINGKVLLVQTLSNGESLDLRELSSGMYFLVVFDNKGAGQQIKFVKE